MKEKDEDNFYKNELVDCYCQCWKYVFQQLLKCIPNSDSISRQLGIKPEMLKETVKLRLIRYNDEVLTRVRSKFEDFWKTFFDTDGFETYPSERKNNEEE